MAGRDLFERYEPIIAFFVGLYRLLPLKVRKKLFVRKRYSKGLYGIAIRYILLKSIAEHIGKNVGIDEGCHILNPEYLSIGDNVSINAMCYIECWGGVEIGDNVSIAHSVTIMSVTHNYENLCVPIKYQGLTALPIKISNNVWIGAKAIILGGNTIDTGSIVGAGSVVTKNVKENTIVAGVPAKMIKERL